MEDPTGSAISGPPGKGELSRKGRTEPSTPSGSQSISGDPSSPVSRSRRSRRRPRSSRSCLMPGIIRCPESTAIQAGNPDHRGRGEQPAFLPAARVPGSDSGSAWSTLAERCRRRPAQRSLYAAGAVAAVAADGCLSAGRYRCAGRRPAVMAARRASRHECWRRRPPGCPPSWRCRAGSRWPPSLLRGPGPGTVRRGPAHD